MTLCEIRSDFQSMREQGKKLKMANIIVFGIPGDTQLYLADLAAGTVAPLNVPAGSDLGVADQLRRSGATITKGVNLAVTVGSSASAGAGRMDEAASARMDQNPASGRMDESPASGRMDENPAGGRMDEGAAGGRMDEGAASSRMDDDPTEK